MFLQCINCKEHHEITDDIYFCSKCNDILEVINEYNNNPINKSDLFNKKTSIWKYIKLLPVLDENKIISLNEGGTTLHRSSRLSEKIKLNNLYIKNEGENPTGSFKDRGVTLAITNAIKLNKKKVICASTGNTSASVSAYSARAGLKSIVVIPSGKIAQGKLIQAKIYNSKIIQVLGNFDIALDLVYSVIKKNRDLCFLNSINPFRIEGQKTLGFEIIDQLQDIPDFIIIPIGNGGNISALWKGLREYHELNIINRLPTIIGVQAEFASPIADAILNKIDTINPIINPKTFATAIRIGAPVNWKRAINAIRESKGTVLTVTDKEIGEAQNNLAKYDGIFVEPAGATSIAVLGKLINKKIIDKNDKVVCITTGNGLKEPQIMREETNEVTIKPEYSLIEKEI
tara:strand:- start:59 stop:1261 length:1203 start_codon:yes stop_codon:yes gene_type:complete